MQAITKFFKLKENDTTVKTELLAGVTTFMTMAYILAVNPTYLSAAGMDRGAVFTATCLASVIGTLCMAFFANYPFALAPGMGLNAYFTYTVVLGMGYSWSVALTAVFVEGIIFLLLSLTNVREAIFNAIPACLKYAVSAGIGLFITIVALKSSNICISNSSTLLGLYDLDALKQVNDAYSFHNVGICVILTVIGVILTGVILVRKIKGGILLGMLITWLLGIICQLTGLYIPCEEVGLYSMMPDFSNGFGIPSLSPIIGHCFSFNHVSPLDFIVIVFSFLFVDMFDTLGTLIGVSAKADMLDEEGRLPRIKGALLADAVATTLGAFFGTSTTTTYVESASGVSEGGRTGLTAVMVALLFFISLFLSPIFLAIPTCATSAAMIVVGFYMIGNVLKISFDDIGEGLPAFITIAAMPLFYSISEGIAMGVISYVLINLLAGRAKEKKLSAMMYILAIIFIAKYIFM